MLDIKNECEQRKSVISKAMQSFLEQIKTGNSKEALKISQVLYDLLDAQYNQTRDYQEKYHICNGVVIPKILPNLLEVLKKAQGKGKADIYDMYMQFFRLSCRANMRNFAFYLESFKDKKVFAKTEDTFEGVFHYATKFIFDKNLELFRLSCMPGLGKSYIGNVLVAMLFGNNPNLYVLRITYSDDLVKITTNQTKAIINSQAFKDVFPRYKNVSEMFKRKDNSSFTFVDCEDESSYFGVTRDGQATGKRANVVIIDDLLKGETESNNASLHNQLLNRYDSDWTSRTEDDLLKVFIVGTMWAPSDLLNVLHERAIEIEDIVDDVNFKYVEKSVDGKSVFIAIPALDTKDKSTAPLRFSTDKLIKKRAQMSEYLWSAVYQQKPTSPTGLEFAYANLKTYPKEISMQQGKNYLRKASLDPARKGKNYVSMPIMYQDGEQHYVVDWLFQKKDMKDLYIPICNKIIAHRLHRLVLENNTDTSLKTVLEEILFSRGYKDCEIIEKYSTQNKEIRIKDNRSNVINNVVFPAKGVFPKRSDIGQAIEELTSYSFDYPNKYDDAIDSIVLYCMEFISNSTQFASLRSFDRRGLKV